MKQIAPKLSSPVPNDIRADKVSYGKYLYFILLITILVCVFHGFFSYLYLLKGEGIIVSDFRTISFDYDNLVAEVFVKEGDNVLENQPLFRVRSHGLETTLLDLKLELNKYHHELAEYEAQMARAKIMLEASTKVENQDVRLNNILKDLLSDDIVSLHELNKQEHRKFDAAFQVQLLTQQKEAYRLNINRIMKEIAELTDAYNQMQDDYSGGVVRATHDGIVAFMTLEPGGFLPKGQTALKIFYGKPYLLSYLNKRSLIAYRQEDTVLLNSKVHGYQTGRISKIFPISKTIPDEFQQPFKPPERHNLVIIECDETILLDSPLLSTVSVRKPMGLPWFKDWYS